MRISCIGFARVIDNAGRHALLVNRGRQRHGGQLILSPIGGGLQRTFSQRFFADEFGADHFEQGEDLRFWVPDSSVERVVAWFETREGRERTVRRELIEELTDETGIFTRSQLRRIQCRRVGGFQRYRAMTERPVPDRRTEYLVEVFDATLPDHLMAGLLAAAEVDNPAIYFVTADEIKAGSTKGVKIGDITKLILTA